MWQPRLRRAGAPPRAGPARSLEDPGAGWMARAAAGKPAPPALLDAAPAFPKHTHPIRPRWLLDTRRHVQAALPTDSPRGYYARLRSILSSLQASVLPTASTLGPPCPPSGPWARPAHRQHPGPALPTASTLGPPCSPPEPGSTWQC
jgi:hypothetical protein